MNGTTPIRVACLGMFLMIAIAPAGLAQSGKHVSLGGAIGITSYEDKDFSSKNPGFSLAYRLTARPGAGNGWRWAATASPGWTNRATTTDIGGTRTQLGKLQMVPTLAGVQRALRQGPWQFGVGILAGPSFNHFQVDQAARDAYASRLATTLDAIDVKNSIAGRSQVFAWYDLNAWLGAQALVSYTINRPKVETTSGGVTTTSTWKTDHASASVGLVFGIF